MKNSYPKSVFKDTHINKQVYSRQRLSCVQILSKCTHHHIISWKQEPCLYLCHRIELESVEKETAVH